MHELLQVDGNFSLSETLSECPEDSSLTFCENSFNEYNIPVIINHRPENLTEVSDRGPNLKNLITLKEITSY